MIDQRLARRRVEDHLRAANERHAGAAPLIVSGISAFDGGWICSVDTERHLRTGAVGDAIVGVAGYLVDRHDGSVHELGSACSIETHIREYEFDRRAPRLEALHRRALQAIDAAGDARGPRAVELLLRRHAETGTVDAEALLADLAVYGFVEPSVDRPDRRRLTAAGRRYLQDGRLPRDRRHRSPLGGP